MRSVSGFSDYDFDGTPNGWTKAKYITQSVNGVEQEVENTTSYAHTNNENGNNALYIDSSQGSLIKDVIPFGKVVSKGKLHVSFDHKIPVASYNRKQSSMILALFNMNNPQKYREINIQWMNIFGNAVYNGRPYWYKEGSDVFILKDEKHL